MALIVLFLLIVLVIGNFAFFAPLREIFDYEDENDYKGGEDTTPRQRSKMRGTIPVK
ncbi:MAG: hypothetical protein ACYDBB_14915 [Armatimonadota bacterium]